MAESWFYKLMGEELGPISSHELKSLAEAGTIDFDTPVRPESSASWKSASKVRGLFDPSASNQQPPVADQPSESNVEYAPAPQPELAKEADDVSPAAKSKSKTEPTPVTSFQANVIIALLLTGMGFPLFSAFRPAPAPTQWEYTIVSPMDALFEIEMDKLGEAGWELVFARRASGDLGPSYEMILRRPK